MNHVRIAGTGLLSCYGRGRRPLLEALREARAGIGPLRAFAVPFAGQLQVNEVDRSPYGHGREAIEKMLHQTVRDALSDAGYDPAAPLERCALVVGCSSFQFVSEAEYRYQLENSPVAPERRPGSSGGITRRLAADFGIDGPVMTLHTACSSSANALLLAHDLIVRGEVERAVVLGAEGLSTIALSGFSSMMLLDPTGCHPFDAHRRGLQLGEAYAALLLEGADRMDTGPYLCGGENLCDIHHITSANPDGSSMAHVMRRALDRAGLTASAITAVKAHGTGSLDNDTAESAAMRSVFGDAMPPFTVFKRYVGHTLGACGALETIVLLDCLGAGFLPPAAGFEQPDPALGVQPLRRAMPAGGGHYLLNFFGFGGNYASLVIRHA